MRAFGCHGKHYFPENDFLLTEIFSLTTEMNFCLHFHFKGFPEKERERERARTREEKTSPSSSPRRSPVRAPVHARGPVRRRRSTLREIAPSRDCDFSGLWLVFFWICVFLLLFQTLENIFQKIF